MRSWRKAEDALANQRPNLNAALSALGLYHVLQILMEYDRQVWKGRQRARRGQALGLRGWLDDRTWPKEREPGSPGSAGSGRRQR